MEQHENLLSSLPNEVTMEILTWLSPKCLMRMKCVNKSWYAVINDSEFAIKHLLRSVQSSPTILFKRVVMKDCGTEQNKLSFLTYSHNSTGSIEDIDVPLFEASKSMDLSGHCHGLLCISECREEILLCNPATREFNELPPSILLLKEKPADPHDFFSMTDAVGFGYDCESNDFKVVRVVEYSEGPYYYPNRAEVYKLSTGCWREIRNPACGSVFWAPSFEMFYDGVYYWWAREQFRCKGSGEVIQTFDMGKEVFRLISVPECFEQMRGEYRSLGVWKGSIILFHYPVTGDEKSFDMWVMEESKSQKGEVSWSLLMTIGPISGVEIPLLFLHNSDELLMEAKDGHVVSYNISTHHLKHLPLKGHPGRFTAANFVKTLLSAKGPTNLDLRVASQII